MIQTGKQIILYGVSWCSDCHRARSLLDAFGVEYIDIDVDENRVGLDLVKQVNDGRRVVPTIIFPDNSILVEPSNEDLAGKLGLSLKEMI